MAQRPTRRKDYEANGGGVSRPTRSGVLQLARPAVVKKERWAKREAKTAERKK